jgi:hypothetical protein
MAEQNARNGADVPLQGCERCGGETFQIWAKWGIWYAMCANCFDEYGLYPQGRFVVIREPSNEGGF